MIRLRLLRPVLATVLVATLGLAACGTDEKKSEAKGTPVEMAFLTAMVHHHETAIEMAEVAQQRGKSDLVRRTASDILNAQRREIRQMRGIYRRLFGGELRPDPAAHDGLGLTAAAAGMTHTPETNTKLRTANPFDRAFIDEMVPHHRGAIRMAKVVLRDTRDKELRALARTIIATQEHEVEAMNSFRERTYGSPVPESGASLGIPPNSSGGEQPGGAGKHEGH